MLRSFVSAKTDKKSNVLSDFWIGAKVFNSENVMITSAALRHNHGLAGGLHLRVC